MKTQYPAQGNWQLLPYNTFVSFWQSVAEIDFKDKAGNEKQWTLGISFGGQLTLFTDLPHPDAPDQKAQYVLNTLSVVEELVPMLMEDHDASDS